MILGYFKKKITEHNISPNEKLIFNHRLQKMQEKSLKIVVTAPGHSDVCRK